MPCSKSLRWYFRITKTNGKSEEFVFQSITCHRNSQKRVSKKKNKPQSYTKTKELFLQVLQQVGIKAKRFSRHRLRFGCASVADNAGVKDRLFKQHARWKSKLVKDDYVEDNIQGFRKVGVMNRNLLLLVYTC